MISNFLCGDPTDVELFNFLKYISDKKILKKNYILTLSNHSLGIEYLEISQRQSDCVITQKIDVPLHTLTCKKQILIAEHCKTARCRIPLPCQVKCKDFEVPAGCIWKLFLK